MAQKRMQGIHRGEILTLITGLIFTVAFLILTPRDIPMLLSHPRPAESYQEALQLIDIFLSQEPQKMNPLCRTQLMTHGTKTARAVILVHGYTSSPQQFQDLGRRFYESGCNVLIAPLPHHGLADLMTTAHGRLTAEELAAYADRTVDIARGLGKEVVMMGISTGGVTTAWAAQNRKDIDLAVIISPAFGFRKIPTFFSGALMNIYRFLPDAFEWWDPVLKEKVPPSHAYPFYSRHALTEILRLGFAVKKEAMLKPPAAGKMIVIFNSNDTMINNGMTMQMVDIWKSHRANLTTYEFEAGRKLPHDLIDPAQPDQRIDIVYPRLMELIRL